MKETGTKLKNQLGKPQDKVTMRYIFQQFSGILTMVVNNGERYFDNINDQANIVLSLLGEKFVKSYSSSSTT